MKILKRIDEIKTCNIFLYRNEHDELVERDSFISIEYLFEHEGVEYKRWDKLGSVMIQYGVDYMWLNVDLEKYNKLEELFKKELARIERSKKLDRVCNDKS